MGKREITEAIEYHHQRTLKQEMMKMSKCEELLKKDLREPQRFLREMSLEEARMAVKLECRMFQCPGNMPGKYRGRMACELCAPWMEEGKVAPVATQDHLLESEAFSLLRAGKDLEMFHNKVRYFRDIAKTGLVS